MQRVQVKTVRSPPWYVNTADFEGALADQVTIYVLLGHAKDRELAQPHQPSGWRAHGFMSMKAVQDYENRWEALE
jgi:hypothetical protein